MFTLNRALTSCGLKKFTCCDNRPPNAHLLRYVFLIRHTVRLHFAGKPFTINIHIKTN